MVEVAKIKFNGQREKQNAREKHLTDLKIESSIGFEH